MFKTTLIQSLEAAAKVILEYSDKAFHVSHKEGINNLVTEVDHKAEEIIINTIRKNFPDHYILSEEAGVLEQDSSYKWIIDPIDGTVNFANHIPICCVSIGLEAAGEIILGGVYNPFIGEFFFAEKGKGATLNQQKIHVSTKKEVASSCLVTGFPYTYLDMPNGPLEVFDSLIREGIPVRRLGSAAIDLCWVAAGRFDGFYEHSLNAWDSAAGYLIVEEAGGKVSDFYGKKYSPYQPQILATNGLIHEEMLARIGWKK